MRHSSHRCPAAGAPEPIGDTPDGGCAIISGAHAVEGERRGSGGVEKRLRLSGAGAAAYAAARSMLVAPAYCRWNTRSYCCWRVPVDGTRRGRRGARHRVRADAAPNPARRLGRPASFPTRRVSCSRARRCPRGSAKSSPWSCSTSPTPRSPQARRDLEQGQEPPDVRVQQARCHHAERLGRAHTRSGEWSRPPGS